jgi:hypothetical protein
MDTPINPTDRKHIFGLLGAPAGSILAAERNTGHRLSLDRHLNISHRQEKKMPPTNELQSLISAITPYWGAEAEIIHSYFRSSERNRQSDLLWISRQCWKEFYDGFDDDHPGLFVGPLKKMLALSDKIDIEIDRHEVLEMAEGLYEEFSHYCAFADAYEAIRSETDPPITPIMLRDVRTWPENEALIDVRRKHRQQHGMLGLRAGYLTEGGYCGLFSEGMKLAGGSPADEAIARACSLVYEDEFGHMLKGIVGLDDEDLSAKDWSLLTELGVEQMHARLDMRNAQFGYPVSNARMKALHDGQGEPARFDFEKAQLAA